jgi:hypothetical protein
MDSDYAAGRIVCVVKELRTSRRPVEPDKVVKVEERELKNFCHLHLSAWALLPSG